MTTRFPLFTWMLGVVDYAAVLRLQRRLHFDVSERRDSVALIVCEHPPLITMGRRASRAHLRFDRDELALRRWAVQWVNRGGGCLWHGPGQLAVYPIVPLDRVGLTVPCYLKQLGHALRLVLEDFSIRHAEVRPQGVFVEERLIAAFGAAVRDGVTYHGAYFNVQPPLELFRFIQPLPQRGVPMTSLEKERRGPVRGAQVRQRLLERFAETFGCTETVLVSDHPVLHGPPPARGQVS
jgi:lipoyl(octanoyl) transferase